MLDRLDCSPEPSSVRSARLFVVDKLQEWRCDELVDSAALVTSELATNAVVHTGKPYTVQVERRPGAVRVEVIDAGSELPPMPAISSPEADHARHDDFYGDPADVNNLFSGLGMVDAVATRWGTEPVPGDGKVVWFELVTGRPTSARSRVVDLRDLRDVGGPEEQARAGRDGVGWVVDHLGEEEPRHMARSDLLEERFLEDRRGHAARWMVLAALLAAAAVGGYLLLRAG
jgi:hypothetical protein